MIVREILRDCTVYVTLYFLVLIVASGIFTPLGGAWCAGALAGGLMGIVTRSITKHKHKLTILASVFVVVGSWPATLLYWTSEALSWGAATVAILSFAGFWTGYRFLFPDRTIDFSYVRPPPSDPSG